MQQFQTDVSSWPTPSFALLGGTILGVVEFADFSGQTPTLRRVVVRNGERVEIPESEWRTLSIEEQFDAVIYYGSITYSTYAPALCEDQEYLEMRLWRAGVESRVNRFCEQQTRQKHLRELLIEARRGAELTRTALALRLRRPQSFVSEFETGERRLDVIEFLEVAEALSVDPLRIIAEVNRR